MDCVERVCIEGGLICICVLISMHAAVLTRVDMYREGIGGGYGYIRTMWNMRGVNARMTALDMSRHMDKPSDYMLCTLDEGLRIYC